MLKKVNIIYWLLVASFLLRKFMLMMKGPTEIGKNVVGYKGGVEYTGFKQMIIWFFIFLAIFILYNGIIRLVNKKA